MAVERDGGKERKKGGGESAGYEKQSEEEVKGRSIELTFQFFDLLLIGGPAGEAIHSSRAPTHLSSVNQCVGG